MGRAAATLVAVAAIAFAVLASPPMVVACTGCRSPFQEWVAGQSVALYGLDRASSHWAVRQKWLDAGGCGLGGTFVFRRLDTLQGRSPATITVRIRSVYDSCPIWFGDPRVPPTGRWIVAAYDGIDSWWHVSARGVVDTWGMGAAGPETIPPTLAGWYAALRAPDTSIADPAAPTGIPGSPAGPFLLVAAVGGLFLGMRRLRPRSTGSARG